MPEFPWSQVSIVPLGRKVEVDAFDIARKDCSAWAKFNIEELYFVSGKYGGDRDPRLTRCDKCISTTPEIIQAVLTHLSFLMRLATVMLTMMKISCKCRLLRGDGSGGVLPTQLLMFDQLEIMSGNIAPHERCGSCFVNIVNAQWKLFDILREIDNPRRQDEPSSEFLDSEALILHISRHSFSCCLLYARQLDSSLDIVFYIVKYARWRP